MDWSSACVRPTSRRCAEPGNTATTLPTTRNEMFASNSSSLRASDQELLAVSREPQARKNVLALEVGVVTQDIDLAHAAGEPAKHVIDGDAQPADTWLASAFPCLDSDSRLLRHCVNLISATGSHPTTNRHSRLN